MPLLQFPLLGLSGRLDACVTPSVQVNHSADTTTDISFCAFCAPLSRFPRLLRCIHVLATERVILFQYKFVHIVHPVINMSLRGHPPPRAGRRPQRQSHGERESARHLRLTARLSVLLRFLRCDVARSTHRPGYLDDVIIGERNGTMRLYGTSTTLHRRRAGDGGRVGAS